MDTKSYLVIYTDGSCIPNPGDGGWAFIALEKDYEIHVSGGSKNTTNNVMELTAVIQALKMYPNIQKFHFYSDSQYVINCALGKWKKNKNIELWKQYIVLSKNKKIKWTWVKGHTGDHYNEIVDKLARSEIRK